VDVGAGLGGPAAYAAHRTGVQPVLVEPEPDACRAAARLFGAPVVQADATTLPFGAATDLFGQAGLEAVDVADFRDITQPPPDWTDRVEAVERELHRRYGHRPELTTADEQSHRIGNLLSSGQLTSQVIVLRAASPART
jgi:hypothetical protein